MNVPNEYDGRARSWRRRCCTAFLCLAALFCPSLLTPTAAADEPSRSFALKITRVRCLSTCDGRGLEGLLGGEPEFYAVAWLNGHRTETEPAESALDIRPDWVIREALPTTVTHVDVAVQVWDRDFFGSDDLADVSQNPGRPDHDRGANLEFRVELATGRYSGDVSSPITCSRGNGGADGDVEVCFELELPPVANTIRVHAVFVADDDGRRRVPITPEEVATWLDAANRVYAKADLRLSFDPDPSRGDWSLLDNTMLNNIGGASDPNWVRARDEANRVAAQHRGRLTILFRFGAGEGTGGGFSGSDLNFVAMPGFNSTWVCGHQNLGLLAHEVGHFFHLSHTFAREFPSEAAARDHYVANGRDPRVFDGDGLSDTAPDVQIQGSCGSDASITLDGTVFALPADNVMAYHDTATKTVTPQQIEIIRRAIAWRATEQGLEVITAAGRNDPPRPAPGPAPTTTTTTSASTTIVTPTSVTSTTAKRVETRLEVASPVAGLTILSARLTRGDNGAPLRGQTVVMSTSFGPICQAVSDADGRASCSGLLGLVQMGLDGGYVASFAGAGDLLPSSARSSLLVSSGAASPATGPRPSVTPATAATTLTTAATTTTTGAPPTTVSPRPTATAPASRLDAVPPTTIGGEPEDVALHALAESPPVEPAVRVGPALLVVTLLAAVGTPAAAAAYFALRAPAATVRRRGSGFTR